MRQDMIPRPCKQKACPDTFQKNQMYQASVMEEHMKAIVAKSFS
jgi:hypothetical protein